MYDKGLFTAHALDAVVISVGNVTVGGTGKTPFVQFVARLLSQKGLSVAVISRGYGGKEKGVLVVSDGQSILSDARTAGDEPVLLAKSLPRVPVVVSPDRLKAGAYAVKRFGSRVLVLDDAFQHRRMRRNLDIVLLRCEDPFGNGWLLPAGPLREPLSALRRADAVVVTGPKKSFTLNESEDLSRYVRAPVFFSELRPIGWVRHGTDESAGLDSLKGVSVLAFAGIGNPKSFERSIVQTGAVLSKLIPFADHHFYTENDLRRLATVAETMGAQAAVTTEKDGVRIGKWQGRIPLYCLRVRMEADSALEKMISRII
jgi:tetraacyldisaccharide 4'-kinase